MRNSVCTELAFSAPTIVICKQQREEDKTKEKSEGRQSVMVHWREKRSVSSREEGKREQVAFRSANAITTPRRKEDIRDQVDAHWQVPTPWTNQKSKCSTLHRSV